MLSFLRKKLDSWLLIAVFAVIYLVSQVAIAIVVRPLGADALHFQTTLSAARVREILAHWDSVGLRDVYVAHFRYDIIHPLWYALLLACQIAKGLALSHASARKNLLLLLPFASALCDEIENFMHLYFLADSDNITTSAVIVSGLASNIKWALAFASIVTTVVLFRRARWRRKRAYGAHA